MSSPRLALDLLKDRNRLRLAKPMPLLAGVLTEFKVIGASEAAVSMRPFPLFELPFTGVLCMHMRREHLTKDSFMSNNV